MLVGRKATEDGNYAEAEYLFITAVDEAEGIAGKDDPHVATALVFLGEALDEQGSGVEAEPLLRRALSIREKVIGPNSSEAAVVVKDLAFLLHGLGRTTEAEQLFGRALSIFGDKFDSDPQNAVYVMHTLYGFGGLLFEQARFKEAEPLLERAVSIGGKQGLLDRLEGYPALRGLALLRVFQGRYPEAESLYQRAVSVITSSSGPDSIHLTSVLSGLAYTYYRWGVFYRANREFKKAREKFEHGVAYYMRALAIHEKRRRSDDPALVSDLVGLAECMASLDWPEEARALNVRALWIDRQALTRRRRFS